ncbi:MAG: lysine biosynthesis protein LysW [Vicinamibacteria bacterium]
MTDLGPLSAHTAACPLCLHPITIAEFDVDRGEIFACPQCGADLEVKGFDPLRLLEAEPVEESDRD